MLTIYSKYYLGLKYSKIIFPFRLQSSLALSSVQGTNIRTVFKFIQNQCSNLLKIVL
jgi:hypothetical protein